MAAVARGTISGAPIVVYGLAMLRRRSAKQGSLPAGPVDVLLVCSTGGHLLQLTMLRAAWEGRTAVWVTFDKSDSRSLLDGETVVTAYGPTNRSAMNALRNLGLALRLLPRLRPALVISTGAGVVVPFAWLGRLLGARIVYVESLTRSEEPSLSLRLIAPVVHRVYVQWPELAPAVRRARYVGNVVGSP